jgi:hypothetical protein
VRDEQPVEAIQTSDFSGSPYLWWPQDIGRHVPRFYFRIGNGDYSGISGEGFDLADKDAAWTEMTKVCGDLVGSIARKLRQQSEWRMELLDESRKPVFRIRVVAETLDHSARLDSLSRS